MTLIGATRANSTQHPQVVHQPRAPVQLAAEVALEEVVGVRVVGAEQAVVSIEILQASCTSATKRRDFLAIRWRRRWRRVWGRRLVEPSRLSRCDDEIICFDGIALCQLVISVVLESWIPIVVVWKNDLYAKKYLICLTINRYRASIRDLRQSLRWPREFAPL